MRARNHTYVVVADERKANDSNGLRYAALGKRPLRGWRLIAPSITETHTLNDDH